MKYIGKVLIEGEFPGSPDIDSWEIDEGLYQTMLNLLRSEGTRQFSGPPEYHDITPDGSPRNPPPLPHAAGRMEERTRFEHVRFAGIVTMFLATVLLVMIAYSAYEHGGTVEVRLGAQEAALEAFLVFPFILFLSLFTLVLELHALAGRQDIYSVVFVVGMIAVMLFFLLFFRTAIMGGG